MKATNDRLYDFYERLYFWELKNRDRITNRVSLMLVLVLALCGLESYLINMFPRKNIMPIDVLSSVSLLASMATLLVAVVYIVRAWHGLLYAHLPAANKLEKHRDELRVTGPMRYRGEGIDDVVAGEMGDDLLHYFVDCASHNYEVNKKKSRWLYLSFRWILWSFASGVLCFLVLKLREILVAS